MTDELYRNIPLTSADLEHYGILGMKWGVRRYQNADGSYTAAGRKRRNNGEVGDTNSSKSGETKKKTANYSEDYKAAHTGKDPRSMTNEELRKTNERLNLERNYKLNTTPQQQQKEKYQYSEGQKFVQQTMKTMGSAVIAAGVTAHIVNASKSGGNKAATFWNESASTGEKFIIGAGLAAIGMGALYYAYHQSSGKSGESSKSRNEENNNDDE